MERLRRELAPLQREEEQSPERRRRQGGAALERVLPEKMEPRAGSLVGRSEVLAAIADAANLNLVSDSHTKPPLACPAMGGRAVEQALSAVCEAYQCAWRAERSAILVRSRHWWTDDPAEPPATAVAQWQSALDTKGFLGLEEAARIAALSPEQQVRLALRIPEASAAFGPYLRLYASLDPAARQAVRSPSGFELGKLPEPHRLLLATGHPVSGVFPSSELQAALTHGQAVLRVAEGRSSANRTAAVFQLEPAPRAGSATQGVRGRAEILLPYRETARSQPRNTSRTP